MRELSHLFWKGLPQIIKEQHVSPYYQTQSEICKTTLSSYCSSKLMTNSLHHSTLLKWQRTNSGIWLKKNSLGNVKGLTWPSGNTHQDSLQLHMQENLGALKLRIGKKTTKIYDGSDNSKQFTKKYVRKHFVQFTNIERTGEALINPSTTQIHKRQ